MSDYWARRNEELEHIRQQFNTDAQYNKELERIYARAQREIDKEIQAELTSFATRDEVSMAEARRRVDKMDVEAFKEKAKRYVKEKNFSPRANEELRAYNTRMRMSRLELLKHNIHLETVALADEEDKLLSARLADEAVEEYRRQAGILGETIPDNLDRVARQLVVADYKGTDFSERIWRNQKTLRNELEKVLDDVLIRGQHPRKASKDLRDLVSKEFGNKKYAAERIAVTESARVQTETQKASYKDYGITQMEWIAEPGACDDCEEMDGRIFAIDNPEAQIPLHPNCKCSFASVVDRNAFEADLTSRGL